MNCGTIHNAMENSKQGSIPSYLGFLLTTTRSQPKMNQSIRILYFSEYWVLPLKLLEKLQSQYRCLLPLLSHNLPPFGFAGPIEHVNGTTFIVP